MNSNNNQRRAVQGQKRPVQNQGDINRPAQTAPLRSANRARPVQGNAPVRNRVAPRSNNSPVSQTNRVNSNRQVRPQPQRTTRPVKQKASGSGMDKIAIVLLLAAILFAVILIGKACKGDVTPRDRYEISDTEIISDLPEKEEEEAFVPVFDESTAVMDDEIKSRYAVMVSRSSGKIIASREADTVIYPASLTKIMSLIIAVEQAESLDDTIVFTTDMIAPFYEQNASLAGFKEGEEVTLRDLLYGMILVSGADATEGVLRLTVGDEASFVGLMNQKAAALGLKDTHFVNAVGLHDKDHYSTCNEMAVILDYALDNETCREILSTYKYTTAPTEQNPEGIELTSNIQSRMEGGESGVARIHGGKTGYTESAGNCLASFATAYSDGEEYIIVTCLGTDVYAPIFDHINACKIYLAEEEITDESV